MKRKEVLYCGRCGQRMKRVRTSKGINFLGFEYTKAVRATKNWVKSLLIEGVVADEIPAILEKMVRRIEKKSTQKTQVNAIRLFE